MKIFEQRLDEENIKSKRVAWVMAGISVALNIALVGTIAYMAPLKQTEVKLLVVDKNTGFPSEVTALSKFATGDVKELSKAQAMNKYFANQYISLYESYNYYAVRDAFALVQLYSTKPVFDQYFAKFKPPIDIEKTLGKDKILQVEITSVTQEPVATPFKEQSDGVTMRARIEKRVIERGQIVQSTTGTVIMTMGYDASLKMDEKTRNLNPFGFTVTSYQFTPDQGKTKQD